MDVLAFGEVLWDIYPAKKVIGGAPFNFAAHLARLGTSASLVSGVGEDALGEETLQVLSDYSIGTAYIRKTAYPTGYCKVEVTPEGLPTYILPENMAYDHISLDREQFADLRRGKCRVLYFGSLAQRGPVSRKCLQALVHSGQFDTIVCDVNIRQSFYSKELLEASLSACTILKFSREEAGVFAGLGISGQSKNAAEDDSVYYRLLCRELGEKYQIPLILLTLDKEGACVYEQSSDSLLFSAVPEGEVLSTVGAGDSFAAAFVHFWMQNFTVKACLEKAVLLSSYVVGHLESVPDYSLQLKQALFI